MDPGFASSSAANMSGASAMNTSGVGGPGTVAMYGSPNGTGTASFRRGAPLTGSQL